VPEKTIYLVRHGITRSNKEKVYAGRSTEGLLEEGVLAAEALGRKMEVLGISAVYTSPIKRALETARIISGHIKGELIVEDDLREIEMGPWEGLSEDEVASSYPSEYRIWLATPADLRLAGRETLDTVQARGLKAVTRILEEHPEGTTIAVTHVAVIRCLLLHYNHLHLNSYKSIDIPNLSVHRLVFDDEGAVAERI
jgi:alpha-ribazole phosphatase/probable phosphoglycerate mutase